jgi:hypothetical protein
LKVSAGILNIRLHPHSPEIYDVFLKSIFDLRVVAQVHGDRYGMISLIDRRFAKDGVVTGAFTTFVQIEADGNWFDTAKLSGASNQQVAEIHIPSNLKANSAAYYFEFNLQKHLLTFQNYSRGHWITPLSALKFFRNLSQNSTITTLFGEAKISLVQQHKALEKLFSIPKLSEIKITILRPNPDIFSEAFEDVVEAHLAESHSKSLTVIYQAEAGSSLSPTAEIKQISAVAVENGKVEVKGKDGSGSVNQSTESFPVIKQGTYDPDETSERNAFFALLRGTLSGGG